MPTLFSYCVAHDSGAAPNPFWGVCTLVICKPVIRRVAEVGDWIVGTGSKNSSAGDMSGRVIYVMKITEKLKMEDYDAYTQKYLLKKVPEWSSNDQRRKVGDSVYDFSSDPPTVRQSVHSEKDRKKDLSGKYALLSKKFWYFGDKAPKLPDNLQVIVKKGPAHRSNANAPYVESFLKWLYNLKWKQNRLHGKPQQNYEDGCKCDCHPAVGK